MIFLSVCFTTLCQHRAQAMYNKASLLYIYQHMNKTYAVCLYFLCYTAFHSV